MTSEAGNGRQERGETPGAGGELFESGAAREGAADESAAQGLAAQLRATECVSVGARQAKRGWRLWGAIEIERLTKREQPCQGERKIYINCITKTKRSSSSLSLIKRAGHHSFGISERRLIEPSHDVTSPSIIQTQIQHPVRWTAPGTSGKPPRSNRKSM